MKEALEMHFEALEWENTIDHKSDYYSEDLVGW